MSVRLIEVGPRDGLQNEPVPIPTPAKIAFVRALAAAGLREIEVTSFVSPKWVPQLADADTVLAGLTNEALYSVLVPNAKGLERALAAGVRRIAVFTAASNAFTERNIAMTVDQSIEVFGEVIARFREVTPDGWVRGYVSTAFECPYAGRIEPGRVVEVAQRLLALGADEVSLGDTIGVAVPREVSALTKALSGEIPLDRVAYHFHDTRGTAVANVAIAWERGVTAFDASAAGLGGCPYAPGAGGNAATEDLVYFFERSGVPTDIDLDALARASEEVLSLIGSKSGSKARAAILGTR